MKKRPQYSRTNRIQAVLVFVRRRLQKTDDQERDKNKKTILRIIRNCRKKTGSNTTINCRICEHRKFI